LDFIIAMHLQAHEWTSKKISLFGVYIIFVHGLMVG
jgi:hypothetical protein